VNDRVLGSNSWPGIEESSMSAKENDIIDFPSAHYKRNLTFIYFFPILTRYELLELLILQMKTFRNQTCF